MSEDNVVLRDVCKSYNGKQVLRNLNLEIKRAEMVALLGPSGCGKSTTLKILAGLENPDSGEVIVNGKEISAVPTRRRNMGIVFQAYSLFPHLSALDNVAYGLKIRGTDKAARRERAGQLLELVGLSEHTTKFPAQLSGGQQQRVALARALSMEPEVLLLDEPLSALDAKVRAQLRDEIRRIQLTEGISTLLVTHDQEEALVMADRVGVMNAGEIAQIADPVNLYANPQTAFISQFVGVANRIPGRVDGTTIDVLGHKLDIVNPDLATAGTAIALIRPEDIDLVPADATDSVVSTNATDSGDAGYQDGNSAANVTILNKQLRGTFTAVLVSSNLFHAPVRVDIPTRDAANLSVGYPFALKIARDRTVIDVPTAEEQKTSASAIKAPDRQRTKVD